MEFNNKILTLMYHGIIEGKDLPPEGRETGAELYDVTKENLILQGAWLKNNDYNVITLNDRPAERKNVIITFDDGEMNNFTAAFPVLRTHKFRAYFFIIVKRVGRPGYMGWAEIQKLHDTGMIIGSHGLSHEILTTLKDEQVEEELQASKKILERNLGVEVDTLSIPRGFCNEKVIDMAKNAGYRHIFISDPLKEQLGNVYSRIAIKGSWPMKRFALAMSGKVPSREAVGESLKNAAKFILRGTVYNSLRSMILKLTK